jgi:hypothetical protein
MALLDLQGMETRGKGDPKDHSGVSLLLCGGDDSSLSIVIC